MVGPLYSVSETVRKAPSPTATAEGAKLELTISSFPPPPRRTRYRSFVPPVRSASPRDTISPRDYYPSYLNATYSLHSTGKALVWSQKLIQAIDVDLLLLPSSFHLFLDFSSRILFLPIQGVPDNQQRSSGEMWKDVWYSQSEDFRLVSRLDRVSFRLSSISCDDCEVCSCYGKDCAAVLAIG